MTQTSMRKIIWLLIACLWPGECIFAQDSTPQGALDTASILKELVRNSVKPEIPKNHRDYLNARNKNELSKEIIAELRKHKVYDETDLCLVRTEAASFLFNSFGLPESDIIAELDKEGTPFEKIEFIELLRGRTDPAAIEALLKQLNDKRIYDEGFVEHRHYYRRVCDWTINIIAQNLTGSDASIAVTAPDSK